MANLTKLIIQRFDEPNIVQIERNGEQKIPFPHQIVVQRAPLADLHAYIYAVVVTVDRDSHAEGHTRGYHGAACQGNI